MNKNLKKIMVSTMFSVASLSAIGCGQSNKIMAKNELKNTNEITSKMNNKDQQSSSNFGKVISASAYNDRQYISPKMQTNSIEENISNQSNTTSSLKLFILTNIPFVNISSEDSSAEQNQNISTNNTTDFNNELNLKRSILMVYVNEIKEGNVTLSEEDKNEINRHIETIKQNNLFDSNQTYNLKKSNIETSTISAIDSIIKIVEDNLSPTSKFYNSSFSKNYGSFTSTQISSTNQNDNVAIAQNIASALKMNINYNSNYDNNYNLNNENNNITTLDEKYPSNKNTQNGSNISANQLNNNTLNQNQNRSYIQNQQQISQNHLTKDIQETDRATTSLNKRNNINNSISRQNNTPRTIRANRVPERNNLNENTLKTTSENNAVRVPYRTTNI